MAYILQSDGGANDTYLELMGVYEESKEIIRKFPVYKQVDGPGLLFVDSGGNWVVGTDTKYAHLYSSFRPVLQSPPRTQWQYYNFENNQWMTDETLILVPTDSS